MILIDWFIIKENDVRFINYQIYFIIANLNDRSQLGNRDSEIAAIVEDNKKIDTLMNGKPVNK